MAVLPALPLPDIDPPPPEDASRCQLLGPTALIVQAMMGVFVIASLIVKRHFEKRKRPWKIWLWDVGKQIIGQAVLHTLNLLISGLLAIDHNNNPCSAYLLNILIDTTIGVAIIYFALKYATWYFSVYLGKEGYESGQYGNPPQVIFWWRQLIPYLIAVFIMKLVVLLPLTLPGISTILLRVGHAAIDYLSPSVQVVFVMMIFPLIMNVVQFCLIDQVIKGNSASSGVGSGMGMGRGRDVEGYLGIGAHDQETMPSSPLLPPGHDRDRGIEDVAGTTFMLGRTSRSEESERSGKDRGHV